MVKINVWTPESGFAYIVMYEPIDDDGTDRRVGKECRTGPELYKFVKGLEETAHKKGFSQEKEYRYFFFKSKSDIPDLGKVFSE